LSLSDEQRKKLLAVHELTLRLELIAALHSEIHGHESFYTPRAHCSGCGYNLTPFEIISGFSTDHDDFTTQCPCCRARFDPKLVWRCSKDGAVIGAIELQFYCDSQTLAKLAGHEEMEPKDFAATYPALYHSAVVHNGTLRAAFAKLGIDYKFVEITNPEIKVKPFLGRIPDAVIAEVSGLKVCAVRRLRKRWRIAACAQRGMIEEAQDNEQD
jgi:hypothetical protein